MLIKPHRSPNIGVAPQPLHMRLHAPIMSTVAVGIIGLAVMGFLHLGPVSGHMAAHIAMMNVAAPLLAAGFGIAGWLGYKSASIAALWSATAMQMALLWAWHSPFIQHAMHASSALAIVFHAGLLLAAFAFWSVLIAAYDRPWQAILALLMSGKFACLLGALLVFSPHLILHQSVAEHGALPRLTTLIDDQQLAGLLMLAACPVSYILAAIYWTAQEINNLPRSTAPGDCYRPSVGN